MFAVSDNGAIPKVHCLIACTKTNIAFINIDLKNASPILLYMIKQGLY